MSTEAQVCEHALRYRGARDSVSLLFCVHLYIHRIIFILRPLRGVVDDVFPDAVHFLLVADDLFVIISLPDGHAGGVAGYVYLLFYCRLK